MKESMWGIFIVGVGVLGIALVFLFQSLTNTEESNTNLLKEATSAAMYDSIDIAAYRTSGIIKIDREKFAENFYRRFAEKADLAYTYKLDIYDINEYPPKVSIKISTTTASAVNNDIMEFELSSKTDAILELPY